MTACRLYAGRTGLAAAAARVVSVPTPQATADTRVTCRVVRIAIERIGHGDEAVDDLRRARRHLARGRDAQQAGSGGRRRVHVHVQVVHCEVDAVAVVERVIAFNLEYEREGKLLVVSR